MQTCLCITGSPWLPSELKSPRCPSPSAAPRLWELPVQSPCPPRAHLVPGAEEAAASGVGARGESPGQTGGLQGAQPRARVPFVHQCPAWQVSAQRPEATGVQRTQTPPGGATSPSPDEARSQASGFQNPHFRPNLHPGLLGCWPQTPRPALDQVIREAAQAGAGTPVPCPSCPAAFLPRQPRPWAAHAALPEPQGSLTRLGRR